MNCWLSAPTRSEQLFKTGKSARPTFALTLSIVFALLTVGIVRAQESKPLDFAHEVVPILKKHCVSCHGGKESKGGLSLNTKGLVLEADVLVLGKSSESRLFELITSNDPDDQMPPKDRMRLSAKELQTIARWIDSELPWEPAFSFAEDRYEPPLKPRRPSLPPVVEGRTNPIDRILDRYLADNNVPSPALVTDRVFLRRVYLDLIGLLPDEATSLAFVASQDHDKRAKLIASLLGQVKPPEEKTIDYRIAYTEHWLTFWNDLLRNDYGGTGFITGGRKQISQWLYAALLTNKPYDEFVRELVAPTADSEGFIKGIRWRGDVNSSQTVEIQFAQNVTQSFLGINMKCASCHDSFIDRWTLEETYNLAAVFSDRPLQLHRCDKPLDQTATARWIFPEIGQVDAKASQPERLKQLAALMTHRENGRLTRTIVNRLWHRLMGRGIVHPVDAMHTEPWNEDLLDYLASDLAEQGYDLKQTIGLICNSAAYQSESARWSDADEAPGYVYSGPIPRRLTAEQFLDAVWQLTGTAPSSYDAPVARVAPLSGDNGGVEKQRQLTALWIWSSRNARGAAAGETRTFRRTLKLDAVPARAVAAVTCDNEYTIYVNGRMAAQDNEWGSVESVEISRFLKRGDNEVLVVGRNAGSTPNAAGLICEIRLIHADDHVESIGTDKTWTWSTSVPNKRGQLPKQAKWEPAEPVVHSDIWSAQITPKMMAELARAEGAPLMMVRASLLKSNSLTRALGRPNRDQIVTSRPNGLTTLEAIDLANGDTLYGALEQGGRQWLAREPDPEKLVGRLFLAALSRPANDGELRLAQDLLCDSPTEQAVADLMWAVLMLPEFQFNQ
jgi:hypothetical protein